MDRPLLILDLDETLIHGSTGPLEMAADFTCGEYRIHKRPFVDEFIRACAGAYTLAVWTSATEDYARGITDVLFADTPPAFVWARDRCTRRFDAELQEPYWVKDLKKVKRAGFDLNRVLFVDDSREKLERHYGNLILVSAFTGDPADRELIALGAWLVGMAGEANLRMIEKRHWRNGGAWAGRTCAGRTCAGASGAGTSGAGTSGAATAKESINTGSVAPCRSGQS